jgi:tetratricopeptide (TPR) repeat protein
MEQVVAELRRLVGEVVIDLDAASDSEDREMIDALIDVEPNRLGENFRRALQERTDGQPLFTTELLQTMRERGDLVRDDQGRWIETGAFDWDVLPARVEGVIGERMGRLRSAERRLLLVGSVEGEEFTAEVVAAVEEQAPRDVVRALSSDAVKSHDVLRARGVLRTGEQRLTRYGFRHNLFQRWLYESIDESERTWLHEDVARALEELHGERAPDVALQLARHYAEAGLLRKSVDFQLLAASAARSAQANEEAATGFEEAMALLERLESEKDTGVDGAWMLEVREQTLEALGDVLSHTGRHDEAREKYQAALEILTGDGIVGRGRIHRKLAQGLMQQHRIDASLAMYDEAEAALGSAEADNSTAWWEEWIEIRTARLWALYWAGTPEHVSRALELVEQTRPEVERHADARLRALFDSRVCILRGRSERYMPSDATMELSHAAFAAARDYGDSRTILDIEFLVGFFHLWRLEDEEAEPLLRSNLENGTRVGSLFQRILALTYLAVLHRYRGEPEEVEKLARACLADATHLGVGTYVGTSQANLAWVALRAGDMEAAREGAEAALELWQAGIVYPLQWQALLPLLVLASDDGNSAAVADMAERLLDPAQQRLPHELESALEAVTSATGDPTRATEAGRAAIEEARALGLL